MAKKPTSQLGKDEDVNIPKSSSLDGVVIDDLIKEPPAVLSISLKRDVHKKFYLLSRSEPNLTKGEFLDKLLDLYLARK